MLKRLLTILILYESTNMVRLKLVSEAGLEPAPSYGYAPQTYVSAGSTTPTQSSAVVADTRYYTIV